ncbi:MAG: LEPR-XLL domain-containing protein [Planctomycetales bacterium]|nr:LEPR-XLL domain-containing protein [Planctomycetales bacterium]
MRIFRAHRGKLNVRRFRPDATFEQLEQRYLLSADLWHAADEFVASQSAIAANDSLGYNNLRGVESSGPTSVQGGRLNLTQRSSISSATPFRSATWAAAVDDAFENNDSFYQAANLGTISQPSAVNNLVMADRADWFQFRLDQTSSATANVAIQFQSTSGDLDLAVYNSSGRLVGYSNGISNSEIVSLSGATAGTYYVYVYGYAGATNPHYALTVNPGQSVSDDRFEPNNTFAQAADLGVLNTNHMEQNLVMADSGDWYRFTMSGQGTSSNYVGVNFQHAAGDLDLEVYNSSGRRLGLSDGVTNSEVVSLSGLSAGTYFVHVYGYRGVTNPNYTLTISPSIAATPPSLTPSVPAPNSPTPTTSVSLGYQIDMNMQGLTASQQAIFREAALHWEQIVVGDVPDAVYNGRTVDDLLIDVSAGSIDGPGGTLGGANADRFRSGSLLPYHGTIQFDSADLASMEANGTLRDVVLHEIGHVLGIGTLWQSRGLLVGAGTSNSGFIGPLAVAEYNALTGSHFTAVPVENAGGRGTRDAHWRESVFGIELMTGYVGPGVNLPLSRLTIASLADLGYQVDMSAADPYQLT